MLRLHPESSADTCLGKKKRTTMQQIMEAPVTEKQGVKNIAQPFPVILFQPMGDSGIKIIFGKPVVARPQMMRAAEVNQFIRKKPGVDSAVADSP